MVPTMVPPPAALIVAALPTCQKTFLAWAPLIRMTLRGAPAAPTVREDAIWKTQTAFALPWASRVRSDPVSRSEPPAGFQTPGARVSPPKLRAWISSGWHCSEGVKGGLRVSQGLLCVRECGSSSFRRARDGGRRGSSIYRPVDRSLVKRGFRIGTRRRCTCHRVIVESGHGSRSTGGPNIPVNHGKNPLVGHSGGTSCYARESSGRSKVNWRWTCQCCACCKGPWIRCHATYQCIACEVLSPGNRGRECGIRCEIARRSEGRNAAWYIIGNCSGYGRRARY